MPSPITTNTLFYGDDLDILRRYIADASVDPAILALLPAPTPAQTITLAHTLPETGYTVSNRFWQYWMSYGGLPIQGYLISPELIERSNLDGKSYQVKYFECTSNE